MGVYELSGAGSVKTGRTLYTSMNAGNMYGAMVPIASTTLAADTATIAFSSIPQTYQDLFVVISGRSNYAATNDGLHLNIAGTQSSTELWGDGANAASARLTSQSVIVIRYGIVGNTATSGIFGSAEIHLLNYANTTTFKTALVRTAADVNGSGYTELVAGLAQSTAAITSFTLSVRNGSGFIAGSTATLYGIRAVSS